MNFSFIRAVELPKLNNNRRRICIAWAAGGALLSVGMIGCGMAASPQPPSLELPMPIHDLSVARVGNTVKLSWNTPSETTDHLKIKARVTLRICRELNAASCETAATISAPQGKPANYLDDMPSALTSGPFRPMKYEIFAVNRRGRSAGSSNTAETLAGEAPQIIQNFSATVVERGVVLHWQPATNPLPDTSIQLQRTMLTAEKSPSKRPSELPAETEPVEQMLRVSEGVNKRQPGTALDSGVRINREYRYVAARVTAVKIGAERLEVESAPSQPIQIFTRDIFPPAAPVGLAAVPVSASMNGGTPEVDLSWSANTEPDLADYQIYRRDVRGGGAAIRIARDDSSGHGTAPAFRDLHVEPGTTYAYSVAAVDNTGNVSARSAEIVAAVPDSSTQPQ
jgi:hypothetical protein